MGKEATIVIALVMLLVFVGFLLVFLAFVRLWVQALLCGVNISILDIIGMKLRRSPPKLIVGAAINLKYRGEIVPATEIEETYLAFGEGITSPTELADLVLEKRVKPTT